MLNKKILLIGDSITEGFNIKMFLSEFNILNKGVSGNNSDDLLKRIETDLLAHSPEIVFILIGTNDLAQGFSDAETISNVKNIVEKISSQLNKCKIYLTSILPTRNNELRPNERIKQLNKKLEKTAVKLNVGYLNLYPLFKDEEDQLRKEFTDDGLHLNESAYKNWAKYLKEFLEKLKLS